MQYAASNILLRCVLQQTYHTSCSKHMSTSASQFFSEKIYKIISFLCFDLLTETSVCSCSTKQVFLKISQNAQENTCIGSSLFLKKVAGFRPKKQLSQKLFFRKTSPADCFCFTYVRGYFISCLSREIKSKNKHEQSLYLNLLKSDTRIFFL